MVALHHHPKEAIEVTITSRTRSTIAVMAAAAAVALVGLHAAPADAAVGSMTTGLRVTPVVGQPGYHWVHVYGNVKMSQAEAQHLMNEGHNVVVRLWGDDQFSDDLLMGPYSAVRGANHDGLWFSIANKVPNTLLNEDWGQDEIYAGVRLVQPNTQTLRSAETNRVVGSF
jgi:hypothetical protein